jgi:hypothetical protein
MPKEVAIDKGVQKLHDAFNAKSMHKVWTKMKNSALDGLKKDELYDEEYKRLSKAFNEGLGPRLDKWDAECAKFPKHDPKKMGQYGADIAKIIQSYKAKIKAEKLPPKHGLALTTVLDEIAAEMVKRLKFYAKPVS